MKRFNTILFVFFALFGLFLTGAFAQTLSPTLVGQWGSGNYYDIAVNGNYAYCAAGMTGIDIMDISAPSNPQKVGVYDTTLAAVNIFYNNNYLYVSVGSTFFAYSSNIFGEEMLVLDVSDPDSPIQVGSYTPPSEEGWTGRLYDIFVSGNYAYLGTTSRNQGLQIVDISDPASPTLTGSFPGSDFHSIYFENNRVYTAGGSHDGMVDMVYGKMQIFDVSTPSAPVQLSSYD